MSISNTSVFRKCLSLLPFDDFTSGYLDWGVKKLTTPNLMRICVASQLGNWASYTEMEEQIRAKKEDSVELFGLSSISGSQLSRRMNTLPSTFAQRLFMMSVANLYEVSDLKHGYKTFGKLHIVDSSNLRLGESLSNWAYVTKNRCQAKFHTRILASSPDEEPFPDKVIPSTGNVDDREAVMELVTDPNATYVMDRGYVDYIKMDKWIDEGFRYAIRINDTHKATILETYETPGERVLTDAKVVMGSVHNRMKNSLRLVEFKDEKGRFYRVVTTRWDLSAEEIAELYKSRWLVELFFKWLKQHLRLTKLQSTKPQGIWNQIFFAMTAYCLALYVKIKEKTKKSAWRILELLRIYADRTWEAFWQNLHRTPKRTSKGRQKTNSPPKKIHPDAAGVALVKQVGEKRSKTAKYDR